MAQYFDPNLIPRTLDSVYNAYLAQQERDRIQQRQDVSDTIEYGKPLRDVKGPNDPDIQAYLSRRRQKEAGESKFLTPEEQELYANRLGVTPDQMGGIRSNVAAPLLPTPLYDPTSGRLINAPHGTKVLPYAPAGTGARGKMLPPASVLTLNEGKAVARQLPDVEKALQQAESIMGPAQGRVKGANPYDTQAQTIDARFRTASQAFGKFMEGGVLRKEDEEKYRKMFPQLSDTPDVARNKLSIVRRMLAQKYEDDRATLGNSGYDVSGFEQLSIPESVFDQRRSGVLKPGTVEDGYRFMGGDPADPSSWEKL